ncbi:MAG: hypothetical protein HY892_14545 [Deltaproteobacteria bacterium]|nr:hypothetical protein [Deltaproteobacteria bacterium]
MGEIKSTLDLIMEKTRGLALSEEEKKKLKGQEWLGKARGWAQRYLDGMIGPQDLKTGIAALGEPEEAGNLLKQELVEAINPEGDNEKRWEALEILWGLSRAPYVRIIEQFRSGLAEAERRRAEALAGLLSEKGISGTAVVPNLQGDPEWLAHYGPAVQDCREALMALKYN